MLVLPAEVLRRPGEARVRQYLGMAERLWPRW